MSRYASSQVSVAPWVLVLLSALLIAPASPGASRAASAPPATCFGREITIMGTPGPDVIRGTADPDSIWGGRGADVIEGMAGDDQLCGGRGDDRIKAGLGFDLLSGGAGNDHMSSPDAVRGMDGGRGDDLLRNDVLGRGTRFTGDVFSRMNGSDGADRLYGSTSGGRHHDQMFGDAGRDVLVAGAGDDGVNGGSGFDIMRGGAGNDGFIVRAWDHETLKGGAGQNDLSVEATRGTAVRVDLPSGFLKPVGSNARTSLIGEFRHVWMDGQGAHVVIGNGLDNEVYMPFPGRNRIEGRGGADLLVGGGGSDYLDGGAPNGPSDPDRIEGSGGALDTGIDTCLNAGEMRDCEVFP